LTNCKKVIKYIQAMIRTSNYFYYDKETYSLVKYRHNTVANGPWSF